MGSLDAHYFHNHHFFGPVTGSQELPPEIGNTGVGRQGYNPFASTSSVVHAPGRYDPLSQSLPVFTQACERPGSAVVPDVTTFDSYRCYNGLEAHPPPKARCIERPEYLPPDVYGYLNTTQPLHGVAGTVPSYNSLEHSECLPAPNGYSCEVERPVSASFGGFKYSESPQFQTFLNDYSSYGGRSGSASLYKSSERPEFPSGPNGYSCYVNPEQSSTARGYNPFSQDYEPQEEAEGSLVSYNCLPTRACTPSSARQYVQHSVFPVHPPLREELLQPTESIPAKDAVVPFDPNQNGKLLWLSKEEAEIIRLIRLSQMKENLRSSGLSLSDEQLTPDCSPKQPAPESQISCQTVEKATSSPPSKSSNVSIVSADDFTLPTSTEPVRTKGLAKSEERKSKRTSDSHPEKATKVDTTRTVDDDRQWITIQRQKIRDIQARKRLNAAVCIQRHWREYKKRTQKRKNSVSTKKSTQSGLKPAAKNEKRDKAGKSGDDAAKTIQLAWRAFLKRRSQKKKLKFPRTPKGLYEVVKFRCSSRGETPPPYVNFLRLLERIHACTEGARIRRRLKTRRLQAIVKEIKEIRVLLEDMSKDTAPASAELLTQLSAQLKQKTLQLHTALQGPGDTARYLLRRGPATPLAIYGSRSTSPSSQFQKTGDHVQVRVIGNAHDEDGVPSVRCSLFTLNDSGASTDGTFNKRPAKHSPAKVRAAEAEVRAKQSYAERPVKSQFHQEVPRKPDTPCNTGGKSIQKSGKTSQYFFIEKEIDTQLQGSRIKNESTVASRLSQYLVTGSGRNNKDTDESGYESSKPCEGSADDAEHQSDHDRPKRPFLRRKSMAMAPQKLDWSKVKPMVSSRLEPELKTKLHKNKVKEIARTSSKKINYNNVKSRLFNYEAHSGVDTSGGLSTDRSFETDFEGTGKQGYAEIHTQADINVREDGWRPALPESTTVPQDEPVPNYRYAEHAVEADVEEQTPKPSPRLPSHRYGNASDAVTAPKHQSEDSALEEIDHNGELETVQKKHVTHSFWYRESVASDTIPVKEPSKRAATPKRERNGERKQPERERNGERRESKRERNVEKNEPERERSAEKEPERERSAEKEPERECNGERKVSERQRIGENSSKRMPEATAFASPELEATFKHVMSMKEKNKMTVIHLFPASDEQAKSTIIPRLPPDASIFNSSFAEKRRLHELLIQEGRASKLQHDSLAFVSIRD